VKAHVETTGPEIWRQTAGRVTHLVAGLGTTGTLVGTARALRYENAALRTVGVEPDQAFHGLEGLKHLPTAITPGIYEPHAVDETLRVPTEDAYAACHRLAAEAGLLVGVSSGAAFHAAIETAKSAARDAERDEEPVVVTIFPDHAERYLDTPAWRTHA
jgi:S-sulfo-L-cysteine synthase (O-acetyl-L-serine-dependent)